MYVSDFVFSIFITTLPSFAYFHLKKIHEVKAANGWRDIYFFKVLPMLNLQFPTCESACAHASSVTEPKLIEIFDDM